MLFVVFWELLFDSDDDRRSDMLRHKDYILLKRFDVLPLKWPFECQDTFYVLLFLDHLPNVKISDFRIIFVLILTM